MKISKYHLSHHDGKIKKFKKPLKQPPPINQEKSYQKDLRNVVSKIKEAVKQYLIPELPYLVSDSSKYKPNKAFRDDATSDLDKIFNKIYLSLGDINEEGIARKHAIDVNAYNSKKWQEQVKHVLGVDILTNEPWLRDHLNVWINTNVSLINSLQDTAIHQVKYEVQSGFSQGLRHESIAKNIGERLDVADSRATLIGRDQVSKLNGQLNQLRQEDIGVESYIWDTAHDERVRDSHAENDGKVFRWDDPPEETGHPSEDVNCRCTALPNFDEAFLAELN